MYAQFLAWTYQGRARTGWLDRFDGIVCAIGAGNNSTDEVAFANAVAQWQELNPGLVVDGILGEKTWAQLEPGTRTSEGQQQYRRPPAMIATNLGQCNPPFVECTTESRMRTIARGFTFVVFETLPVLPDMNTHAVRTTNMGLTGPDGNKLVRKIAIFPQKIGEIASDFASELTPAEHAFDVKTNGQKRSPWLSASNRSHGAPKFRGINYLIDLEKVRAKGGVVVTQAELIADLRRYQGQTGRSMERLIATIQGIEGETLIRNGASGRRVSTQHQQYITAAEEAWDKFDSKQITKSELEKTLSELDGKYEKLRGRSMAIRGCGRALAIFGVAMTVADFCKAGNQSIEQGSVKPIAAETIRQVGGWGGSALGGWATALAAAKIGGMGGAAAGVELGPGAVVTGVIGAVVFGVAGYYGADWVADWIHPN